LRGGLGRGRTFRNKGNPPGNQAQYAKKKKREKAQQKRKTLRGEEAERISPGLL